MARSAILAILAGLLLGIGPLQGSPVRGHYREARSEENRRRILEVGATYQFDDIFRANQRACVIVEGDHNPVMNLTLKVYDYAGNVVASDTGGDCLAVIWYPQSTERYRITVRSDGTVANLLDIVVK